MGQTLTREELETRISACDNQLSTLRGALKETKKRIGEFVDYRVYNVAVAGIENQIQEVEHDRRNYTDALAVCNLTP